jgi:hypothetical protein
MCLTHFQKAVEFFSIFTKPHRAEGEDTIPETASCIWSVPKTMGTKLHNVMKGATNIF